MKMHDFKNDYPVLQTFTYLNIAASGLLSKSLADWRKNHDMDFVNKGSIFRNIHHDYIVETRKAVARFFDASEGDVALVPNFSFGLNTFLEGFPKDKTFLLLENDYPSVNWPFENRGFGAHYAKIDENLEANIEAAIERYKPDAFAFSIVQYLNGIKIDLDFLKKIKEKYPNLILIADGTQYLGSEAFSFSESAIDVLGASTYKWMMAGYGNGVFLIKEAVKKHIFPKTIGFNSAETMYSNRNEIAFIKHFEPGHLDTLNYGTLTKSIEFLEEIGIENISQTVKNLSNKAKKEFMELDLLEARVAFRKDHSPIFNIKGDTDLFEYLLQKNIICSQRSKGIRVSFHFYNTEEDLNYLVEMLKIYFNR